MDKIIASKNSASYPLAETSKEVVTR
jgi:hypothetical protein